MDEFYDDFLKSMDIWCTCNGHLDKKFKAKRSDICSIKIEKTDDKTVSCIAFDKNNKPIYKSKSKCGPDDIFDFNIGAKLALDRLYKGYDFTPKSKNLFSGKILFINPDQENNESLYGCSDWEVKDGLITSLGYANSKDRTLRILRNMPCSELTVRVNDMYFPYTDWSRRNKVMYLENYKT